MSSSRICRALKFGTLGAGFGLMVGIVLFDQFGTADDETESPKDSLNFKAAVLAACSFLGFLGGAITSFTISQPRLQGAQVATVTPATPLLTIAAEPQSDANATRPRV